MSDKFFKDNATKIIVAVVLIVIGILFIVEREAILGVTFTLIGAALIAYGIYKMLKSNDLVAGIALIVIGVLIISFGWALSQVACVIAGIALIVYSLYALVKKMIKTTAGWVNFAINTLVGIFLILGVINASWIFIVIGVMMILYGISFLLM